MSESKDSASKALAPGGASPLVARLLASNDAIFAVALAVVLATLLIPLPTFLLDVLLSCSIAISIATLVIVLSARESIEFSTFPSLLLFVTLSRLSLNVASTRLILLHGNAGKIIATFGNLVVGGNFVIGLVVFLILVIIQFVVITKGAERISEVAARFNLDAMPGKQMAIDADLNAGLIGEAEAKARRKKIVSESEFYGAMDGASKFIRGDAIAGLIIVAVNLVGGMVVGTARGMSIAEAIKAYSILAIGDGLVSQIPAVIVSTASGLLVSKTTSEGNISQDLLRQMLARSRPIAIASFFFGAMVLVPGFPKAPFVALALGAGLLANLLKKQEKAASQKQTTADSQAQADTSPEELLDVDPIAIQVGTRLIKLVDPRRKNSLADRIVPLRRKFAQQYGIILPLIRLRDNVMLDPDAYEIRLYGHVAAQGALQLDKYLAMDPGTVTTPVQGQPVQEPVFNLPALWVSASQKEEADLAGYTVVDPESVMVTHLSETLKRHAGELLSRDDVQKLVDHLRGRQPALVNDVVGETVSVGLLQRVLKNLLNDGIPVRDLARILETLGEHAFRTKDPVTLTELVRKSIARTISEHHADASGRLHAITLDPSFEFELRSALRKDNDVECLAIPPERVMELVRAAGDAWRSVMEQGYDRAVLLCDARLRPHLASVLAGHVPMLPVLAYDEVASRVHVESVGVVSVKRLETVKPEA
jgi:flagellar biosynthesis protein FlhA